MVFDIIFHPIVNTVRKIAVAEASWLMLSSTLLFAELPDLRRPVSTTPESISWSQNYQGRKSEICLLGIEKPAQTYVTRLFAYSSPYFRPRWKRRHQQVWEKTFLGQIVPGNFSGKAAIICQWGKQNNLCFLFERRLFCLPHWQDPGWTRSQTPVTSFLLEVSPSWTSAWNRHGAFQGPWLTQQWVTVPCAKHGMHQAWVFSQYWWDHLWSRPSGTTKSNFKVNIFIKAGSGVCN